MVPWAVSAKSPSALNAQAARLAAHLRAHPDLDIADVGWSLAGRSTFEQRAVILGSDRDRLLAGLDEVGRRTTWPARSFVVRPRAGQDRLRLPGPGLPDTGHGNGIARRHIPVFAEAFNTVVAELDRHLLRPLREVMWGHDENLLNTTEFAQPALFAVEVALFRLLESWGVRPDFVMGHSIGELSAAHVAGVLSLENAAVLVAARGRFMQALPVGGAMIAVQATEEEVRPLLVPEVGIAAVNGPASVVISGAEDAVIAVADRLRADGRRVHQLAVSHAFHSPVDGSDDRRIRNCRSRTRHRQAHDSDRVERDRAAGGRRLRVGSVLEATRPRGGAIRRQCAFRAFGRRKPLPRSRAEQRADGIDRRITGSTPR